MGEHLIYATDRAAFLVRGHQAYRRRNDLTPHLRQELAPVIAELAGQGMSDPKIGKQLGVTEDQVYKIRKAAGIPAGRPKRDTYRAHKPVVHEIACPACGIPVDVQRHGGLAPHRKLGPSRHGVRIAVDCDGPDRYWVRRTEGES